MIPAQCFCRSADFQSAHAQLWFETWGQGTKSIDSLSPRVCMQSELTTEPIQRTDRLLHLDVLRGFALFGILLVNFEWFTRSTQTMLLGSATEVEGLGGLSSWLIEWLAESKFFPLFSMLFGMGFAIMMRRAQTKGRPFVRVYLRRLIALALFGLLHAALIWSGDILFMYAVIAFIMILFFRNTPTRRLWKWAMACWLVPLVFTTSSAVLFHVLPENHEIREEAIQEIIADYEALQSRIETGEYIHQFGTYRENIGQRLEDLKVILTGFAIFWIPMVLGYFLFGRWLIESEFMIRPDLHIQRIKRWQWAGLSIGLVLSFAAIPLIREGHYALPDWRLAWGVSLYVIGSIALALAYLALVTRNSHRLQFLAPAGRMALTNYLLQSLFWTTVFYGYGLGLWGRIPHAAYIPLSVIFFTLQIAFSHWWMKRHRYGPLEWLWRVLTYLRRPA